MAEGRKTTKEKLITDQDYADQQAILEEINTLAFAEIEKKKEEKLGKGGFSAVFKAGAHYAISESIAKSHRHKKLSMFQERASTLLREANIRSPFLQIHEYRDQKLTKIMPLGIEDLSTFIKKKIELKPELSEKMIAQIALGIYALHNSNLVHGDLKLLNILVMPDGLIQIIDLNGVAKVGSDGIRIDGEMETIGSYVPKQLKNGLNLNKDDLFYNENYYKLKDRLKNVDARAIDIYAFGLIIKEILDATKKPLPSKFNGLIKLSKAAIEYDPENKIQINMILNTDLWGKLPEDRQRYFDALRVEAVAAIDKTKPQGWHEHAPTAGQALNIMPAPIQDIYILHEKILKQLHDFDPENQGTAELCAIKRNINQIITQLPDVLKNDDYKQYHLSLNKVVGFVNNLEKKQNDLLTRYVNEEYTAFKENKYLEKELNLDEIKDEEFRTLFAMQERVQVIVALVDKEDMKNQDSLRKLQVKLVKDLIQHDGYIQKILNKANLVLKSTNAAIEKGAFILGISEQCKRYSSLCQLIHDNLPEGDVFKEAQVFSDIADKLSAISKFEAKEMKAPAPSVAPKPEAIKSSVELSVLPKPKAKEHNASGLSAAPKPEAKEKKPPSPNAEPTVSKKSIFVSAPTENQQVNKTPHKKSHS